MTEDTRRLIQELRMEAAAQKAQAKARKKAVLDEDFIAIDSTGRGVFTYYEYGPQRLKDLWNAVERRRGVNGKLRYARRRSFARDPKTGDKYVSKLEITKL